jgi:L-ascorbate metabolism protein UlaG (beta-lactamase superfamily)
MPAEICSKRGAALFANFELAMFVKSKGAEKLEPMNTGGTGQRRRFRHHARQRPAFLLAGRLSRQPERLIVRPKEGKTLYHMGDTDMFGGMALIAEFHRPQIGIVPIGDRFTMGARSAAFTCKKFFQFEMILPCHYGTFPGLLDPDADKFVAEMKDHNVIVPKVGQTVTV